ncbi:kinase-like domain-containing protein [Hypoxylon cercidicola]|nr:kinase-like domain-containing protein [Hypoxylon cercidicola]
MATKTSSDSLANTEAQHDRNENADMTDRPQTDKIIQYESSGCYNLGLEDVQRYNKGGYHPVHLDDILNGRFEVFHKLGNGGFGTVWLCRDIIIGKWRAVKIMTADHSSSEEKVLSHLRDRYTPEELEDNHIMIPLEDFWIEGPNGRHHCLVMPVCGWTVSSWRLSKRDYKPGTHESAQDVCRQIIKSLYFLHGQGICHGDFRPENILMKIEGIDELDKEEMSEIMGEPECYDIETVSGQPPGPRAPEYRVQPVDNYWCQKLSTNSIAVIDFGESFFMESPPKSTGIPSLYAAPEILFEGAGVPGPYSDIWSLACTVFEVRTNDPLFASGLPDIVNIPVREIESYLGPLPLHYRRAFVDMLRKVPRAARSTSSKRESDQKPEPEREPKLEQGPERESPKEESEPGNESQQQDLFEKVLGAEQRVYVKLQPPGDVPPEYKSSEFITWQYARTEVIELADLLRKMLKYDPAERIDIEVVASHPWAGELFGLPKIISNGTMGSSATTEIRREDSPKEDGRDEIIEYASMGYIEGIEDVQRYNKGGYHPVHLDDVIDGRFKVFHKLGSGGFGTVWLCRDITMGKWRAVKVMAADHSTNGKEEKILNRLRDRCTSRELDENHIVMPLEEFWLEGPNGRHICYVMPVLGWTVSSWRQKQKDYEEQASVDIKNVCRQIIESLSFLHSHGICHGDFKPGNILMKVDGIDDLSEDELIKMMGEPDCFGIETESGLPTPKAPEYCVVSPSDFWSKEISTKSIAVIDFGESFFIDDPPASTGIPSQYGAPEVIFEPGITLGRPSDIWSLACTLYEVRTNDQFFSPPYHGFRGIVDRIEFYTGPLPQPYRRAYIDMCREARGLPLVGEETKGAHSATSVDLPKTELQPVSQSLDELTAERNKFADGTGYRDIFEAALGCEFTRYQRSQPGGTSETIKYRYPREDVLELADLLRKMLKYDPAERISINTVRSHPWARTRSNHVMPRYFDYVSIDGYLYVILLSVLAVFTAWAIIYQLSKTVPEPTLGESILHLIVAERADL